MDSYPLNKPFSRDLLMQLPSNMPFSTTMCIVYVNATMVVTLRQELFIEIELRECTTHFISFIIISLEHSSYHLTLGS